jgi:hypothetical protein
MYVVCIPLYASLHHVRHFGPWKQFLNVPYKYILLTYLLIILVLFLEKQYMQREESVCIYTYI